MENTSVKTISNLTKGIFGVTITTETEPTMRKTNNPFIGRVQKVSVYSNAILGVDYQNCVNNRIERLGGEPTYESEAPKGKKWYNPFFYVWAKDENQYYLKIGMYKNTEIKSTLMVDGRIATSEEVAQIKCFIPEKKEGCQKQADAGLETSEQYKIVAPKLQNVVMIRIGERIIC